MSDKAKPVRMSDRKRERWLDIAGYRGRYQVSTEGRVRSLPRIDDGGNRRTGRLLKPQASTNERRYVLLCRRGVARLYCVSALLAQAYQIPNPGRHRYVVHRNGDNRDFRARNLDWVTLAGQRMHDGNKANSRYYGVTCDSGATNVLRWLAFLRVARHRHDFGCFATPEEAAYAYDRAVRRLGLDRPLNGLKKPPPYRPKIESLPGERWRRFPGAARTHLISNRGRVRTLAHRTSRGQRVLPKLRKITVSGNDSRSVTER
jgi:hypothetical protein